LRLSDNFTLSTAIGYIDAEIDENPLWAAWNIADAFGHAEHTRMDVAFGLPLDT